jgi:ubiquinone/menaquinone biosynthesis C-methylase UbiE
MPLAANIADVVVSNCVLNLVPDKKKAFSEIFRILKKGGHFSVSDIVLIGELPDALQKSAELYAGCVSGAIQKSDYLGMIHEEGFENIKIQKEKVITLPNEILKEHLSPNDLKSYTHGHAGIFSITVYAEKPRTCCKPGCCD